MFDLDHIVSQVKHNCNVSDAGYWGLYSPCGLLLRVRDLFKMEKGMMPWEHVGRRAIGGWIDKRERLWEDLAASDFVKIEIGGKRYRPFDVRGINREIRERGLYYGAGYGNLLKPTFFLAVLSKSRRRGAYQIHITGREFTRDLSTSPSMLQGNTIIVRSEILKMLLWEKFEEMMLRKADCNLSRAFSEYGISKDQTGGLSYEEIDDRFTAITQSELSSYIYHEIGEASQRRHLGRWWKDLVCSLPYSRAELFVRALKDLLSDTCNAGMLPHIIHNNKAGSLAFHIALFGGIRKVIFPELLKAYEEFRKSKDWAVIERARLIGYRKARGYTDTLKRIATQGRVSPEIIEKELIAGMI